MWSVICLFNYYINIWKASVECPSPARLQSWVCPSRTPEEPGPTWKQKDETDSSSTLTSDLAEVLTNCHNVNCALYPYEQETKHHLMHLYMQLIHHLSRNAYVKYFSSSWRVLKGLKKSWELARLSYKSIEVLKEKQSAGVCCTQCLMLRRHITCNLNPCFLLSHLISRVAQKSCDVMVKSWNPENIWAYFSDFIRLNTLNTHVYFLFHSMPTDSFKWHTTALWCQSC